MLLCCCSCNSIEHSNSASRVYQIENLHSTAEEDALTPGIYQAIHRKSRKVVTVKVLNKNILRNKLTKLRLRKEVKLLSRLKHPNIMQLEGMYETQKTIQLVFEWFCGGPIYHRIISAKPREYKLGELEISAAISQVAEGLKFLHQQNYTHGNIRPEHLYYSSNDSYSKVLITNFGAAAATSTFIAELDAFQQHNHNQAWRDILELRFLPPWVLRGKPISSVECLSIDVWSLGVLMYMLLFGCFPFDSDDENELQVRIKTQKVEFPPDLDPYVSLAAKDLIHRILDKDAQSPATIEEVLRHPWILNSTTSSSPFSLSHRQKVSSFFRSYDELQRKVSRQSLSRQDEDSSRSIIDLSQDIQVHDRTSFLSADSQSRFMGPSDEVQAGLYDGPDCYIDRADAEMSDAMRLSTQRTMEVELNDDRESQTAWRLLFGPKKMLSFKNLGRPRSSTNDSL